MINPAHHITPDVCSALALSKQHIGVTESEARPTSFHNVKQVASWEATQGCKYLEFCFYE